MNAPQQYKPEKPYPDFPMGWHRSGYWCKRILGKLYYFGERGDTSGKTALADFNRRSPYLFAGQDPDDFLSDGYTLHKLCNDFMAFKEGEVEDGNLSQRTFTDYLGICQTLLNSVGKQKDITKIGPDDFENLLSEFKVGKSPVTVNNFIGRVKVVFNFAVKTNKLVAPNYGLRFRTISPKAIRQHRKSKPSKLFSPEALQHVLNAADVQMRAIILLGINCGFGNADIGRIEFGDINLESGWHNYARGKTGVDRRCPLWPETVAALNAWLAVRDSESNQIFHRPDGTSWHTDHRPSHQLSAAFARLNPPDSLTFYCLRHSFETCGGKDQIAINHIMGHAPKANDMGAVYRESIDDDRLTEVSENVRQFYLDAIQEK